MTRGRRPSRSSLLLLIGSLCLGLVAAEAVARRVLPRPGFQPYPVGQPPGLIGRHPVRGYAYTPRFSGRVRTPETDIAVMTNELGLRDEPFPHGAPIDILAIGDSFTAGFGVDADSAWPSQLESQLGARSSSRRPLRVVNGGISGYSARQARQLLEEIAGPLNPRIVIAGVYASRFWRIDNPYVYFHGTAVLQSDTSALTPVEGGFLTRGTERSSLMRPSSWLDRNCYVGAHLFRGVRAARSAIRDRIAPREPVAGSREEMRTLLAPLVSELEETQRYCLSRDIRLVVLLIVHQEADGSFLEEYRTMNAVVSEACDVWHVPVVDPVPEMIAVARGEPTFRLSRDHHWSPHAHRVAADALCGRLLGDETLKARLLE